MKTFLVLGSEPRQEFLFQLLKEKGYKVSFQETYQGEAGDVILLPVPAHLTKKYLDEVKDFLTEKQTVFGCQFPKEVTETSLAKFVEYMSGDEMAYLNAIATSEGAVCEAMKNSTVNLHKAKSLVIGYGRCGSVLADKLLGLRSDVTVMERKPERRALASGMGCSCLDFNESVEWKAFDFIFNTVPAPVVGESILSKLEPHATIIDIASGGKGVDYEYCKKHHINAHLCLGLPGKYAPKSSAAILLKVIEQTMGEI